METNVTFRQYLVQVVGHAFALSHVPLSVAFYVPTVAKMTTKRLEAQIVLEVFPLFGFLSP